MTTFLYSLLLFSVLWIPLHAQQNQLDTMSTPNRPVYRVLEETPQYPGGLRELNDYIKKNLRYPEAAQKANQEGMVIVTFIVSEQGVIHSVQVLRSVSLALDAEAVRLIKSMPDWIPGKQQGKAVACRFNLPVRFSLPKSSSGT
ncbi:energy transducer TonB [Spirosoma validum]|uniref:Energy transducer TonB n=1 Tax=Spirosoma validum TaxID=2771355 RepID=A0A927GBG1_9BACT|nr:energy transducer TonB [Spirosoma validum]MBD2751361.1 energy transducer TonB [Spirosoma validum]